MLSENFNPGKNHSIYNFMMRKLFLTLLLVYIMHPAGRLNAVPAYPFPVTITQPDGSTLTVQLKGDEFHKIKTSIDGYFLRENNQGFLTYAVKDPEGKMIAGDVIARDPEKRTNADRAFLQRIQKYSPDQTSFKPGMSKIKRLPQAPLSTGFPKTGSPRSLVIMVNFSDTGFVTPNPVDAFTRLLNQEDYSDNGGTGSARDYFRAASYGLFSPQFDVAGPYTLSNSMAYYGANDADLNDVKPAYLIVDACAAANAAGIDFTSYDADNDGYLDNIFVYYAGYNEAEGGPDISIWPHRWAVQPGVNFTNNQNLVRFDGKIVFDYACTSELRGSTGTNMCGIGTFTHEFGHVISMPDYYHTTEKKNALNNWSIMDAGAYLNLGRTPPIYSAYDRFYLGWLTPEQINTPSERTLLPLSQSRTTVANTNQQAYLLSATTHNLNGTSPSPAEFYIMEYRKKTGWDTYLPAEGLLFWHIDYNQSAWDENTPNNYTGTSQTATSHMRCYLQPLSGYTTTPGTAFSSGSFTPLTWLGTNINRAISEITKTSDSISFKLMGGTPPDPNAPVIKAGYIYSTLTFPTIKKGTEKIKTLNIKTTDITSGLTIALSGLNANQFMVSVDSIAQLTANSLEGSNIQVKFKPTVAGSHIATLTISGGGIDPAKVITLTGVATE